MNHVKCIEYTFYFHLLPIYNYIFDGKKKWECTKASPRSNCCQCGKEKIVCAQRSSWQCMWLFDRKQKPNPSNWEIEFSLCHKGICALIHYVFCQPYWGISIAYCHRETIHLYYNLPLSNDISERYFQIKNHHYDRKIIKRLIATTSKLHCLFSCSHIPAKRSTAQFDFVWK